MKDVLRIKIQHVRDPSIYAMHVNQYSLMLNGVQVAYMETVNRFDYVEVRDVVTFEPYRRRGFMSHMLKRIRRLENKQMRLVVYPDNEAAVALYKSLGWRTVETTRNKKLVPSLKRLALHQSALAGLMQYVDPLELDLPEMVWSRPQKPRA